MTNVTLKIASIISLLILSGCVYMYRPLILPIANKPLKTKAEPAKLQSLVESLTNDFSPRGYDHPEQLIAARDFIAKELSGEISFQEYKAGGRTYYNVISNPLPKVSDKPLIVIGAHYDSCLGLPGADDNASGIAGLIELSRLLHESKLNLNVELVAYNTEEPPFFNSLDMGSSVHARALKKENRDIKLMITLEMIGYFTEVANTQDYPLGFLKLLYPSRGDFIAIIGDLSLVSHTTKLKRAFYESTNIKAYSINAPKSIPGITFSDHLSYWREGFPAVMVTDTAMFRNKNYHTSEDTPEKLDYNKMAEVVNGVFAFLSNFS